MYPNSATWPGRGHCLTETVWAGSRERFLVLCCNGLNRNGEWGLMGRDNSERHSCSSLYWSSSTWNWNKWDKSYCSWFGRKYIFHLIHLYSFLFKPVFEKKKYLQPVSKVHFNEVLFLLTISIKTKNISLLPLWSVSASQGPVPSPASINLNRIWNFSLLSLWTIYVAQASLPGQLISPFIGPFCKSCLSVKSCSPVWLIP